MTSPVTTRHTPKVPSLSLPADVSLNMEARPALSTTPPSSTIEESAFYMSPKSPKAELARTKSQSRRTLGNWQLGKTIGQGSMGRVRLGHNLNTGEQVRSQKNEYGLTFSILGRSQNYTSNTL